MDVKRRVYVRLIDRSGKPATPATQLRVNDLTRYKTSYKAATDPLHSFEGGRWLNGRWRCQHVFCGQRLSWQHKKQHSGNMVAAFCCRNGEMAKFGHPLLSQRLVQRPNQSSFTKSRTLDSVAFAMRSKACRLIHCSPLSILPT